MIYHCGFIELFCSDDGVVNYNVSKAMSAA